MIVSMHNICKDFPLGKTVSHILKNVDLSVEEGDYIAIMGPSGSGKSTLMNIIGCLDVATSGEYHFLDQDINKCNARQLADIRNKQLGFVFQSYQLLPKLTALDNVALPLLYGGVKKSERRKMAQEALDVVGLGEKSGSYPDTLSGGQRQRVAIARAIVGKPKLLLADEPTGALDSASGKQVMEIFKELNERGSTIIMITHDQNVANNANTIKYIYDGYLTGGEDRE